MSHGEVAAVPVDVTRLEEGLNTLDLSVESEVLGLEWPQVRFESPIDLELGVVRMGDDLQIDVGFETAVRATCDRCLAEFELEIDGRCQALGRRGSAASHELGDQDGVVFYDDAVLDLGNEVRESLLLKLPMRTICKEDCAGLCPQCGVNRNITACDCSTERIDPRWAALRDARPST